MAARRLLLLLSKATPAQIPQPRMIATPVASPSLSSLNSTILRLMNGTHRAFASACSVDDPNELEAIFQKKRALRSKIRMELKSMSPIQKAHEGIDGFSSLFLLCESCSFTQNACFMFDDCTVHFFYYFC